MSLKLDFQEVHVDNLNGAGLDFFLAQALGRECNIYGTDVYEKRGKLAGDNVVTFGEVMFSPTKNGNLLVELMDAHTGYTVNSNESGEFMVLDADGSWSGSGKSLAAGFSAMLIKSQNQSEYVTMLSDLIPYLTQDQ